MTNGYTITAGRREFIESRFFQWWLHQPEDYYPSRTDFLELQHPAELHYLAHIYNWDNDATVLKWVLESPHCSRATANLIFWRSLPSYFEESDFSEPSTCPPYCEAGFALIPMVLQRYRKGDFSRIEIAFDPEPEMEDIDDEPAHWEVPEGVFDEIQGLEIRVEE
jgi:hypothetical protein